MKVIKEKIMIKMIVGLGNPTKKYIDTRHNIGFRFINILSFCGIKSNGHSLKCNDFKYSDDFVAMIGTIELKDNQLILVKPQTFMNYSGVSVQLLAKHYNIKPEEILVVHDEIHVKLGKCKLKFGGSAGGNNGLKSIIEKIGDQFWRLRIGIDKPENTNLLDYVLSEPNFEDKHSLDTLLFSIVFGDINSLLNNQDKFQREFH